VLADDGRVWSWGGNKFGQLGVGDQKDRWSPEHVHFEKKVTDIEAGWWHTLYLL
jgi:alpha-tubulin suppressor-like RCC1 family protein